MNDSKIREVTQHYRSFLKDIIDDNVIDNVDSKVMHAHWLAGEVLVNLGIGKRERALRMFGFLEGILWAQGWYTISEQSDLHARIRSSSYDELVNQTLYRTALQ